MDGSRFSWTAFIVMIQKESMRAYGVSVAAIEFGLALWLWFAFDGNVSGMQFMEHLPLVPSFGINYILGVDGISLFIIVLAAFFTMIGIASLTDTPNVKYMIITLLFLQMTMVGVFVALDAIVFYVFWELSLVPMLYIIGAWGGPLRIYASIKFFLYTFAGSLVMLVGMLFMAYFYYQAAGVWSFALLDWYLYRFCYQGADVSIPYMVTICTRSGTDYRFCYSCGNTFENGNIRVYPFLITIVP